MTSRVMGKSARGRDTFNETGIATEVESSPERGLSFIVNDVPFNIAPGVDLPLILDGHFLYVRGVQAESTFKPVVHVLGYHPRRKDKALYNFQDSRT